LPNSEADVPEDVQVAASDPETNAAYQQEVKDTLNPLPASDWSPDLSQLDAMVASLTFPTEPQPSLTGTTWQWEALTVPNGEIVTPDDPASYTILFNEAEGGQGTAEIQADCNSVGATYTVDANSIDIALGPSTLAECGEASLGGRYLSSLEAAAIYFFQDGDLFMDLMFDSGTMRFSDGAAAESPETEPEPTPEPTGEGTATGTITAPDGVWVRSGPGTEYPTLSAIPFEATVTITGRNEDSSWWQVERPTIPVSEGWIAADFVDVSGGTNVPVVEAVSPGSGLVGTTWQWLSTVTPAEEITVNDPTRYTIIFNTATDGEGSAEITADCNNVGATYSVDESNISITLGPSTRVACPEDSLDQQFLTGLENAAIFFFEGDDLLIDMVADGGTMRFGTAGGQGATAAPPAATPEQPVSSAQGVTFELVSFGPEGAEQSVLPGTQVTANFGETEVNGSAGCNNYTAPLTPVDDYFTVGPIAVTAQACSEPAGIMEQEQAYLAALEGTDGYLWISEPADGNAITAGQIFYTLADGTTGVINYVAR
jgi:heat shock protein HslJ